MFNNILQDPGLATTYLVIDALDECVVGMDILLRLINETSIAKCRVKWIVSSPNWPNIEKAFTMATDSLSLSLEHNEESVSNAVATYIELKTESLAKENDYNSSTQEIVRRHLIQNASGTFLWVALVCQELATMLSWEVNEESLAKFPPGLSELYKRMMGQINISRHSQLCKSILATLSIVHQPITLDELPSLVEIPVRAVGKDKALAEIIGICGSFLSLRCRKIYFTHQSAKDFLFEKEVRTIFPSGEAIEHQTILRRSIKAMSPVLRKDIYSLGHPSIRIEEVEHQRPKSDPLAPIRYACIYWIDHLCEAQTASDNAAVRAFLEAHFLHWFEALSILRVTHRGVLALSEYVTLLVVSCHMFEKRCHALTSVKSTSEFADLALAHDMERFAMSNCGIIKTAPLQLYVSALVFSPTNSLIRRLFIGEGLDWIIHKTRVEESWDTHLTTFEGHGDSVTCMTFSADGWRVASGSYDHTVKIWNTQSSNSAVTLQGHSKSITCIVFSADGQRIASGSYDKTVKIWDIESGDCTITLESHIAWISCVTFSTDNGYIASGSFDKTVKIWDTESVDCKLTFKGHNAWISCVAFSADGQRVASGSYDKTVKIWDSKSGACVISCDIDRTIKNLRFGPTTSRLYTDRGVISIEDAAFAFVSTAAAACGFQDPRHVGYYARSGGSWITWNGENVLFLPEYSRPRCLKSFGRLFL